MSVNINDLLARAAALRDETALNSISPDRAGGIMYDTLLAMNELWLQQGSALVISKIYASVAAMEADSAPVSDLTGQPLRPGQIVVIASSDSDNGSVYRYDGTEDDTSSWSLVGAIGSLPVVDSLDSDSSTLPLAARQGKALKEEIDAVPVVTVSDNTLSISGEPQGELAGKIIESSEWIYVITDSENKIIEGVSKDGTKYSFAPQATTAEKREVVDRSDFIEVVTDENNRIIRGTTKDGKTFIGDFDEYTKALIKSFAGDDSTNNVISIPLLNANFASPVPVTVVGTKGDPDAQYIFKLPLKGEWNVRLKFKLMEDLIKNDKTATIAAINGASVVAHSIVPSQCVTGSDEEAVYGPYTGTPFEDKWPAYSGGVAFNKLAINHLFEKQNIGRQAFSVRYVGQGSSATVENTGDALVFDIDGVEKSFSFSTYPTVNELFAALDADPDFELEPLALDYHNSSELVKFGPVQLISTLHGNTNQQYKPPIIEYTDNGPLYLHYAINEDWHQIEIVKLGDKIYSVCDGNVVEYSTPSDDNILTLGGECGVLFKDLEICTDSPSDFEYVDNTPISSVNPYIVIFEAHDVNLDPTYQQPIVGNTGYNQNIDTLDWVFAWCKNKGYTPVSIEEIARYYICGEQLPKRCYTIVLDGWHWNTIMNIMKRGVFLRYGVKPAFAIEKRDVVVTPIEHNGQTISIAEAVKIAKTIGFSVVCHTINHTSTYAVKPSDRKSFVSAQVYDFEPDGIDGQIYVFPGGCTDPYMNEVFECLGMKAGIEINRGGYNNILRNRFALGRLDISTVYKYTGEDWIKINYNPGKLIKVI